MEFVATVPARHVEIALAGVGALLFAFGLTGFIVTRYRSGRRHLWLRTCPLCAADAVAAIESEPLDEQQTHVLQRCGQCGTWRYDVATHAVLRLHERMLEKDRKEIRREAERLNL